MNLHYLHPRVTVDQVAAELAREEAQRKRFYPAQVELLKMSPEQAEHELACVAAWREDLARFAAVGPGRPLAPASHGLTWRTRRQAIARELELRRRVYPRQVEQLKLERGEADHRLSCLEALADRYDDGLDWRAGNGERPMLKIFAATPAETAAAEEWEAHMGAILAARAPVQQGEMRL